MLVKKSALLAPLVLVALGVSSCARVPVTASRAQASTTASPVPATKVLRVVKTVQGRWGGSCTVGCSVGAPVFATIPTPAGAARFDVVVTVTMDYAISARDTGRVGLIYCRAELGVDCPFHGVLMLPGRFPIASSHTITLTWVAKGLRSDSQGWIYSSDIELHDGSGDDKVTIHGNVATAVFEMTPAS
jgi:hypothetical protein